MNTLKSTPDAVIQKLREILKQNGASISKCDIAGLEYLIFVKGSGPHSIDYGCTVDGNVKPPKELLVSRKCAEAVLRGAEVSSFLFLCGCFPLLVLAEKRVVFTM